jgi:cytochrome c556
MSCSENRKAPRRRNVIPAGVPKPVTNMKFSKPNIMIAALCMAAGLSAVQSQEEKAKAPRQVTSNQLLMRDKLAQMNQILAGITLGDFDQVEKSARTLGMISKATSWHIVEQTPRYKRLSKNFQEQAADLERHAREKDEEAAALDLVRMNITCTDCHQHMRTEAARGK